MQEGQGRRSALGPMRMPRGWQAWEITKSGPCSREQQVGPDDGARQGQPQDGRSPKCRYSHLLHLGDNTRKIITAPFLV